MRSGSDGAESLIGAMFQQNDKTKSRQEVK